MSWFGSEILEEYASGDAVISQEVKTRGDFVFAEKGFMQIEKELNWCTQLGMVSSLQTQENMWNATTMLLKLADEVVETKSLPQKVRDEIAKHRNGLYYAFYGTSDIYSPMPGKGSFPKLDDKDFLPLHALYPNKEQQAMSESIHRVAISGFIDADGNFQETLTFQSWRYYRRKAELILAPHEAKLRAELRAIIDYRIAERMERIDSDMKKCMEVLVLPAEKLIKFDHVKLSELNLVGEQLKQGDLVIPYLSNKTNVLRNRTKFQDKSNVKVYQMGANFFVNFASLMSYTMNAPGDERFDRLADVLGFIAEGILSFYGDTQNIKNNPNRRNIMRITLNPIILQKGSAKQGLPEIKSNLALSYSRLLSLFKLLRSASNVRGRWTDLEYWDFKAKEFELLHFLCYAYGKMFSVANKIMIRDPYLKGVEQESDNPWVQYASQIPDDLKFKEEKDVAISKTIAGAE